MLESSESILIKKTSLHNKLIKTNISLSDKNWFGTGGPAKYFCELTETFEFQSALEFANKKKLPIFVLGHGANILISDEGFDGLIIKPLIKKVEKIESNQEYVLVKAQAGISFQDLIDWSIKNNLSGLEEFSGIPGTVGGSVFINIHYFEYLLSMFLVSAEIIEKQTGTIINVTKDWFNFSYNHSKLHESNFFLISATFKLKVISNTEKAYSQGRRDEIIRHRQKKYPHKGTCGSFFRNFFEKETNNKIIFVAYYLDKIGVKGTLSVGNAIVSYQHANMIINKGNATSNDIIELAKKMQSLVYENFGIMPQPECRLIGFKKYPLL